MDLNLYKQTIRRQREDRRLLFQEIDRLKEQNGSRNRTAQGTERLKEQNVLFQARLVTVAVDRNGDHMVAIFIGLLKAEHYDHQSSLCIRYAR